MKTVKRVTVWALMGIFFSSCHWLVFNHPPESVSYNLGLSFQDASGKNLVKGIELTEWNAGVSMENAAWGTIHPDLYVLDIILGEPGKNQNNDTYNSPARPGFMPDVSRPHLLMEWYKDNCYLINNFSLLIEDYPEERIVTYKLKMPYVFGDEAVREFVTYWDIPKKKLSVDFYYATCNRIVFEGREIIPEPPAKKTGNYVAKIILK